jgi:hypothetical protein
MEIMQNLFSPIDRSARSGAVTRGFETARAVLASALAVWLLAAMTPALATTVLDVEWRLDGFMLDDEHRIAPAALIDGEGALVALACARHGAASLFLSWPGAPAEEGARRRVRVAVEDFGEFDLRMRVEAEKLVAPYYDWDSSSPMRPIEGTVVPEGLTEALGRGSTARVVVDDDTVLEFTLGGSLDALRRLRAGCP